MTNNSKTILMLIVFVVLLGASGFAYNYLSKSVEPEGTILVTESEGKTESETEAESEATAEADTESEAETKAATEAKEESDEDKKLKAPDFTVFDKDGNEVMLSDLLGKPVVMNFWASWCPPCIFEMPDFEMLYKEVGNDVEFMMINLTDGMRETKEIAEAYVAEEGYTFNVYYDTKMEATIAYGVRSIPATLFIDKEGYVAAGVPRQLNEEILRKGIGLIYPKE